ncbi:MAG: hypothetical protein ABR568_07625 [Pyrinomonadaceae bacterium]
MITGYNTDVEHGGVVYHVQTEDKGLDTPLILSLVYSGGAILASKRSRYEDLIASGFSDEALSERLKRQHLLICAAIHAGRVGDLKRMAGAESDLGSVEMPVDTVPPAPSPGEKNADEDVTLQELPAPTPPTADAGSADTYTIHDPRRQSPLGEVAKEEEGIKVSLLDEQEFRSGDALTLRIMVSQLSGTSAKPMNGAVVSVKVLGTAFRPMIYSMKTQKDGVATVTAQIPKFTSGRAAILIRALAGGNETELRRVIHAA